MKEEIPEEDGGLKRVCNDSFHAVRDRLGEMDEESEKVLAGVLGGVAGYVITKAGGKIGEALIGRSATRKVASHCLVATAAVGPIAKAIAPRYVKAYRDENPRYSNGERFVRYGAIVGALEFLLRRD